MSDATPDWSGLKNAVTELGKAMESVGFTITAQGALGWMLQGDLERARETLETLPVQQLQAVSVAAAAVSSLADEIAAGKESDG